MVERLREKTGHSFIFVGSPDELIRELAVEVVDYIFFPHWSWIIPEEVWGRHECVIFHMTDLPYGRGGSPLQNLIVRGKKETKISALKCSAGLDEGDIYCKVPLALHGTAEEIFKKMVPLIEDMIISILTNNIIPSPQVGVPIYFKRRTPEDGCINHLERIEDVYDYIRMLDAETYPNAFVEIDNLVLSFTDARLEKDEVIARVKIKKREAQ
jgi:methionyl-tRNA formyltransferase